VWSPSSSSSEVVLSTVGIPLVTQAEGLGAPGSPGGGSVVQGSQHGRPSLVKTPIPFRAVGTGSTPYFTMRGILSFGIQPLNIAI